jgi:ribonuclease-3 family protein
MFGFSIGKNEAKNLPLRVLAHLGDAVFSLYERERAIAADASAQQIHRKVILRVSASKQADLLGELAPHLTVEEQEIVRMARNLKPSSYNKSGQAAYRKATAFEALLGYLYLTDIERLTELLAITVGHD